MPLKITKIEPQKKSKNRYSLFADERFVVGVSQNVLIRFNLHAGKTISDQELQEIEAAEHRQKLRDQALRYLSRRAHSRKELRDKIRNKGYQPELIEQILDEFSERGYIDDGAFTRMFIDEEVRFKYSGPLLIRNKLLQKGIAGPVIEQNLAEIYIMDDQIANCRTLAHKKYRGEMKKISEKEKSGLISYLKSKGFHWEHISTAIPEILKENHYE